MGTSNLLFGINKIELINPKEIKEAEIIVGIPSYNEAKTIGFVVEQVSFGLEKYFPNKKSVIVNLDNFSSDGTKNAFFKSKGVIPKIYLSTHRDVKGKGHNLNNLFLMVKKLRAKVGISFDADLRSIRPEWVKKMVQPILEGYDFVAPYYARYKNDGTITNHLVYPLVYGLLGLDIRQPIGGDFAFSDKIVGVWLEEKWHPTTYEYGIDIFMSLIAFCSGMKICQVNLGCKIHNLSSPKLGPMFFQVNETLFKMILWHIESVKPNEKIKKPVIFGGEELRSLEHADFNKKELKKGQDEIYKNKEKPISLDDWMKIVYDSLFDYKESNSKKEIIQNLSNTYFFMIDSFFRENGNLTQREFDQKILERAKYFRENRSYFFSKQIEVNK